jgi:hypothetical protein
LSSLEIQLAVSSSHLFGLFSTASGSLTLMRLGSSGRFLGSRSLKPLPFGVRRLRLMRLPTRSGLRFALLGLLVALLLR